MQRNEARTYLLVPPEEYPEVEAAGAAWDGETKRWYVPGGVVADSFWRWRGDEDGETPESDFQLAADQAFVASARIPCQQCQALIEVICLYADWGVDLENGDELRRFTVSNMWAMDQSLAAQLEPWPCFRQVTGDLETGYFANHCSACDAMQEDYLLHAEPGDVFFALSPGTPGAATFTPLEGTVRVSGDYSFGA